MTGDDVTWIDHDPRRVPGHLPTNAPHVHVRGSGECVRSPGEACLSGEALRARVVELETEVERLTEDIDVCWVPLYHGAVNERRLAEARAESAEAERDALQQRLANVQARVLSGPWWSIGDTNLVPVDDVVAALGDLPDQKVTRADIMDAVSDAWYAGQPAAHDAVLAAPAVSSRPGMTVAEAVADALADHRENTGQITGGTPQKPQQADEASDIRLRLNALADEWERVSGLASPLVNADITSASPAQRTLWEAASELREVLVTWPSGEDEARAWRLRAWASSRAPARQSEPQEPQPTPEAKCGAYVGQGWDQEGACYCVLRTEHAGECQCRHTARQQDEEAQG